MRFKVVLPAYQESNKNGAGQPFTFRHDVVKQGQEMVVFRLPVVVGRVDAVVQGQKAARFPAAVHPVDPPDARDHAVRIARVLALGHVDEAAVALVLYTVIHQQKGLGRVAEQRQNQFAQLIDGQCIRAQKSVHLVMAHIRQMGRQMRACVIGGRTQQILDVDGLGQHERAFLPKVPQSA